MGAWWRDSAERAPRATLSTTLFCPRQWRAGLRVRRALRGFPCVRPHCIGAVVHRVGARRAAVMLSRRSATIEKVHVTPWSKPSFGK